MTPFAIEMEGGGVRENTRFYFSASSHLRKILLLKLKENVPNYYSHRVTKPKPFSKAKITNSQN